MWIGMPRWAGGGWIIFIMSISISQLAHGAVRRKQDMAYVADPAGIPLSKPNNVPSKVGSPASLIQPDRYEFYTFDESGELIKRLMTLAEIQDIIATGDGEDGHVLTIAQTDLNKPAVTFNFQPPSHTKVHTIVSNVQNVLKAEMEAHKNKPPNETIFDTPDVSSSWSQILPAIFGNTGGNIVPDNAPPSHFGPETDIYTKTEESSTESSSSSNEDAETTPIIVLDEPELTNDPKRPVDDISNIDTVINSFAQAEDLLDDDFSNFASKTTDDIIPSDFIELSTASSVKNKNTVSTSQSIESDIQVSPTAQNYISSSIEPTTQKEEKHTITREEITEVVIPSTEKLVFKSTTEKTVVPNISTNKQNLQLDQTTAPPILITESTSLTKQNSTQPIVVKPTAETLERNPISHGTLDKQTTITYISSTTERTTEKPTHIKISSSNANKIQIIETLSKPTPATIQNIVTLKLNATNKNTIKPELSQPSKPEISTIINKNEVTTETTKVSTTKNETANNNKPDLDINKLISQISNDLKDPIEKIVLTTPKTPEDNETNKNNLISEQTSEKINTINASSAEINYKNKTDVENENIMNTTAANIIDLPEKYQLLENVNKNQSNENLNTTDSIKTIQNSVTEFSQIIDNTANKEDLTTTRDDLIVTKQPLSELSDSISNLLSQISDSPKPPIVNNDKIQEKENLNLIKNESIQKENLITTEKSVNTSDKIEISKIALSHNKPIKSTEKTVIENRNKINPQPLTEVVFEKIKTTEPADHKISVSEISATTYRPRTTTIKVISGLPQKLENVTHKATIQKVEIKPQELKTVTKGSIQKTSTITYKNTESTSTEKSVPKPTEKIKPSTTNDKPLKISLFTEKHDATFDSIKYTTPIPKTEPIFPTTTKIDDHDDELMAMLNIYSEMFNNSPELESKSEDGAPEIVSSKKNTYKKTDEEELLPIAESLGFVKLPNSTYKRTDQSVIINLDENANSTTKNPEQNETTKINITTIGNPHISKNEINITNNVTKQEPMKIANLIQTDENTTNFSKTKNELNIENPTIQKYVKSDIPSIDTPKLNISDSVKRIHGNNSIVLQENLKKVENTIQIQQQNTSLKDNLDNKDKKQSVPIKIQIDTNKEQPVIKSENEQKKEKIVANQNNSSISTTMPNTSTASSIPLRKAVENATLNKDSQFNNESKESIINRTIDTINQNEKNKNINGHQNTWKLISSASPKDNNTKTNSSQIKSHDSISIQNIQAPRPHAPNSQNLNKIAQLSHIDRVHLPGLNGGEGLEKTTSRLNEDVYQFSELCNELGFRYWNAVISNGIDPKRTVFISPFALTSILAMLFMATRGSTSEEMNDILKLDEMVTFNPHIVFKNVTESIEVSKRAGVATSAFVRELYSDQSKGRLLSFYKDRVQKFYNGHVEEVNFSNIGDIIRKRTNLLVKRQTWSKINEYIKQNNLILKPPLSVFSANIFQTDCSTASTDGRDGEMYFVVSPTIRQRRLIPVPAVLYKSGILAGYVPDLDATAIAINKGDQIVSTILVMPGQQGSIAHGDDINDLQRRLLDTAHKEETWKKLLKSLIPRPGLEVQIPRFSHRSIINGTSALQRLGLRDLFDASKANLAGLNGQANDLHVSDMILDNTFTICGEGYIREQHHIETYPGETNKIQRRLWRTPHRPLLQDDIQAPISDFWEEPRDYQRAFNDPLHDTSYLMMPLHLRPRQARLPEAPPEAPRLKFDRPFMFFVRHNPTGLILHMGRYNPRLQP